MSDRRYRIFISSPGDVGREREVASRVISRVDAWFGGRLKVEGYFWEHEPMRATRGDFQQQIPEPASFDLVICILWSRLGSRLHPGKHMRPDGSNYASGTEYEFENALEAYRHRGKPDLLVYRRTETPLFPPEPRDEMEARLDQWESLKNFCERWFRDEKEGTFTVAFNTYKDSGEFEIAFEEHLKRLVEQHLSTLAGAPSPAAPARNRWWQGSPYQGLRAFEFEHEPIFFGRTTARDEVLGALRARWVEERCPFVLVFGASGSGKSSLMRAGILPWLVKPGVVDGVGLWRIALLHPASGEGDLMHTLAAAITAAGALPELLSDGDTVDTIAAFLRDEPKTITPLIKGALSQASAVEQQADSLLSQPVSRLALGIDQLEEIFTLRDRFGDEDRTRFFRAVASLARSGYVWIVTTLRSDFYSLCEDIPELVELKKGRGQYHLLPPTDIELSQMIRHPAEAAGLPFEEHPEKGKLDEAIIRDAAGQPGVLPLLEYAMEMLYHQSLADNLISHAAYERIGRVSGAVTLKAEETFAALLPHSRAAFPSILGELITLGDSENAAPARKPAPYAALTRDPAAKSLVDAFLETRLFTIDASAGAEPLVNLSHESLLRVWPRVTGWVSENLDFLRRRARLAHAIRQWLARDKHPDLLLARGLPLAEAEELRSSHPLTDTETAFIKASQARVKKENTRRNLIRAAVVIAAAALLFIIHDSRQRARAATAERQREQQLAAQRATQAAAYYKAHQSQVLHGENFLLPSLLLAADAFTAYPDFTTRSGLLSSLISLPPDLQTSITGFRGDVTRIRFSPSGDLAAADTSGSVHAIRDGKPVAAFTPEGPDSPLVTHLAPADGGWTFSRDDGSRFLLDRQGRTSALDPLPASSIAAFSPVQNQLAIVSPENPAEISIIPSGGASPRKESPGGRTVVLAFSRDGTLASGNDKGAVSIIGAAPAASTPVLNGRLTALAWQPAADHPLLLAGDASGHLVLLRDDGTLASDAFPVLPGRVTSLAWHPDGQSFAASCADGSVRLWPSTSVAELPHPRLLGGHKGSAQVVEWTPDGALLASGGSDGAILFWNPHGGPTPIHSQPAGAPLTSLAIHPPSGKIAAGSSTGSIHIRQGASGLTQIAGADHDEILTLDWNPDGSALAAGTRGGALRIHRGDKTATLPAEPNAGDPAIWRVRWSPDGAHLAASSHSGSIRVFDPDTGTVTFQAAFPDYALGLAWSPDSSQIAASSTRGEIFIWNLGHPDPAIRLPVAHTESVGGLAWHPSGRLLASCGNDGTVRTWNLKTRTQIAAATPIGSYLEDLAWSPDGSRIAAAGADGHHYLWDGPDLVPFASAKVHDDHIWVVAWLGNRLFSASADSFIRDLLVDDQAWLETARRLVGPDLSPTPEP